MPSTNNNNNNNKKKNKKKKKKKKKKKNKKKKKKKKDEEEGFCTKLKMVTLCTALLNTPSCSSSATACSTSVSSLVVCGVAVTPVAVFCSISCTDATR
jgi:dihydroxyacetone kinase-like predicted kinase